MRDSIQIRPAQPVDAEVAAVLLYSAYTHTHVTSPLREEHASGLIERLQHFFRRDGNRFSYQYIQLADQSSEVVGLVLSFGGRDEERLNATAGSWLELQARQHHYPKIALHVAQGNKQALDLYAHLHYVVTQQTFLYQRPYVRMVKTLENWEQGNDGTESTQRRSQ